MDASPLGVILNPLTLLVPELGRFVVVFLFTPFIVIFASLLLVYLFYNVDSRTRLALCSLTLVLLAVASVWFLFQAFILTEGPAGLRSGLNLHVGCMHGPSR